MRVFRVWLELFGIVMIAIALAHLLFGQSTYIGGGPVSATMESDLRFYNVVFLAYGLAFIWAARDIPARATAIQILGAVFFGGGLVRLLAWAVAGTPSWFYIAMIPVELIIPIGHHLVLRQLGMIGVGESTGRGGGSVSTTAGSR